MAPETPAGRELEAETLLWIARLPLLRLDALSALTGASAEEVRRAVDALRRHGSVERLSLDPGLAEPGPVSVYALRPVAVSAFSDAFGMDERVVRAGVAGAAEGSAGPHRGLRDNRRAEPRAV